MTNAPETPQTYLAALAAAGSAGLLAGAFLFQHVGGLAPCPLCIWQRWPHALAFALGLAMLAPALREARALRALGLLAMLTSAGLGLHHTGVERGWWPGPGTCSGGQGGGLSADQLMDSIMAAPLVRCDEVAWQLLGLSMASWNALISLALAGLWLASLRRPAAPVR
ncbi:MAG: disulfide bond formation protein B [Pseudomonadota bacterium]